MPEQEQPPEPQPEHHEPTRTERVKQAVREKLESGEGGRKIVAAADKAAEAAHHPRETVEKATEHVKESVKEAPEKIKSAAKSAEKGLYKKLDEQEIRQGGNDENISVFGAFKRGAQRVEEKHNQRGTRAEELQKEKHETEGTERYNQFVKKKHEDMRDKRMGRKPIAESQSDLFGNMRVGKMSASDLASEIGKIPNGNNGHRSKAEIEKEIAKNANEERLKRIFGGATIAARGKAAGIGGSGNRPAATTSMPPRPFSGGILTTLANSNIGALGIRPGRGGHMSPTGFMGNVQPLAGLRGITVLPNFGAPRTSPISFGFQRASLPAQYRGTTLASSPLFQFSTPLSFGGKFGMKPLQKSGGKSEKGKPVGKLQLDSNIATGRLNLFGRR